MQFPSAKFNSTLAGLSLAALLVTPPLTAAEGSSAAGKGINAADNSAANKNHDGQHSVSADQQKNNETDVELTRKIRSALIQDKSLSTYAHNVKIISSQGSVVLKGPVRSETEKQNVESKAMEVAGREKVKSELQVAVQ